MQWSLILLFLMGQSCLITCQLYEYHYVEENKTWSDAQQYCRKYYTDLVTVSNMTDMKRLISESSGNMNEAWIGLKGQININRTWYWSLPGVEFNKSDIMWHSGEPNDHGIPGPENCGFIWNDLTWGDQSCRSTKAFFCYDERDTSQKFYLIQNTKTWLEAQSYCREKHTDLVSGWNQLQDPQLNKILSSLGSDLYIYMGLFRDTWRWSDGSSFSFRHWNLQYTNEQYSTDQCAMTVFDDGGRWMPDNCTRRKPFICYKDKVILIKENQTWGEALYYCRNNYHDLVTITNLDEQRWVQEKAKQSSTPFVWMGLHYTCAMDFWFWVSGEPVSYMNWVSDGQTEECNMSAAMGTDGQHQWVKMSDSKRFNFICSRR